jgi:hypothetical protein
VVLCAAVVVALVGLGFAWFRIKCAAEDAALAAPCTAQQAVRGCPLSHFVSER